MLLSESDDVFTDSLAQSIRELWPIITSKVAMVVSLGFPAQQIFEHYRTSWEMKGVMQPEI